jgi:hypothetical protein
MANITLARRTGGRSRGKRVVGGRRSAEIVVDEEERRHLIEDCAFFRAVRFRDLELGCVREQDLEAAAADIDAAIGLRRRQRTKR